MKVIAENDSYKLYLNEDTTNFALQSKSDSYVWWATPLNADKDENAKTAQRKNMQSPFYIVYGDVSTHTSQRMNIYDGSIKSGDFEIQEIENGVKIIYRISKIEAEIPMTITLEKDNVNVSIISEEIKEKEATDSKGLVLLDIGLLQFFNAATSEDEGYMVVPDGSGAVINYNNQLSATLYDIYNNEEWLTHHSEVEEEIFIPAVRNAERKLKQNDVSAKISSMINQTPNNDEQLSDREKDVIIALVQGMSNKEIADHLFISVNTVITHRRNIARKLQIHSPAGLTIYAIVNDLVDISTVKL